MFVRLLGRLLALDERSDDETEDAEEDILNVWYWTVCIVWIPS